MHKTHEKTYTRSEQTANKADCDSRRDSDAGRKSRSIRNQQKRVSGADGTQQCFIGDGSSVTGGILCQLIEECKSQLASDNELKKQVEAKIAQMESRIQEFTSLLEELESKEKT